MANQIVPWIYFADNGRQYVTGVNSEVAAQTNGDPPEARIGGTAAVRGVNTGDGPLPSSVKPRRVYLKNAAGKGRYLTLMEPTAYLSHIGNVINIEDSDGVSSSFEVVKVLGEDFGRSRV